MGRNVGFGQKSEKSPKSFRGALIFVTPPPAFWPLQLHDGVSARGAGTSESRSARGPPRARVRSRTEGASCRATFYRVPQNRWRLPTLGACVYRQVTLRASRRVLYRPAAAHPTCLTRLSARPVPKYPPTPPRLPSRAPTPNRALRSRSRRHELDDDPHAPAMCTRLRRGVAELNALAAGVQVDDDHHR